MHIHARARVCIQYVCVCACAVMCTSMREPRVVHGFAATRLTITVSEASDGASLYSFVTIAVSLYAAEINRRSKPPSLAKPFGGRTCCLSPNKLPVAASFTSQTLPGREAGRQADRHPHAQVCAERWHPTTEEVGGGAVPCRS